MRNSFFKTLCYDVTIVFILLFATSFVKGQSILQATNHIEHIGKEVYNLEEFA